MEGQEIRGLMEAYSQVYETSDILVENAEQLDELTDAQKAKRDQVTSQVYQQDLQRRGGMVGQFGRFLRQGVGLDRAQIARDAAADRASTNKAYQAGAKAVGGYYSNTTGKDYKDYATALKDRNVARAAEIDRIKRTPQTQRPADYFDSAQNNRDRTGGSEAPTGTGTGTGTGTPPPPKQTIVLAKKDGVEGKLDKATGKFTSGNFSDEEKARYAKFSKPTTPTSTNADKSTTPTNTDKSTTPTNTDKPSVNPEWAKANPRLAEVERLRAQQKAAGKSTFDKEFRDKNINPVMYNKTSSIPNSGRSVEDSKKMFPDTPKPAPTQTPAAGKAKIEKAGQRTPPAKPAPAQAPSGGAKPPTPKPVPAQKPGSPRGEDLFNHLDLFDLVKGHLLDEGYADTEESAMVIMVNMSEAWRESILESHGVELDEAQRARENPEEYERSESRRQSKRERAMNDPHTGINSPAFAEFMRQQMGGKKKKS